MDGAVPKTKGPSARYPCDQCGKIFVSKYDLPRHMKVHTEPCISCDQCGMLFIRKGLLSRHMKKVHAGKKTFLCNLCGNTFSLHIDLILHQKTHKTVTLPHCEICGKTFTHITCLWQHQRAHRYGSTHHCDECDNIPDHKESLTQHEQRPTGEQHRPDQCGNTPDHKDSLTKHQKHPTGEQHRPDQCENVPDESLTQHQKRPTGELHRPDQSDTALTRDTCYEPETMGLRTSPASESHPLTNMSSKTSVATQMSAGPLRQQHYQTQGVQASVGPVNGGTVTDQPRSHLSSPSGAARPRKRRHLELKEEDDKDFKMFIPPTDSAHDPGDTELSDLDMDSSSELEDTKFIVFESSLRELFDSCPVCMRHCRVDRSICGTLVAFSQNCPHCLFTRTWQSMPMKGTVPQGNLELSAAVYFNGGSYKQIERICSTMNLKVHHYDTFRRHAQTLLEPAICHKWKVDQAQLLEEMKRKGRLAICGDMRADSPGHSARFGSYSIMELEDQKILDIQLVQSSEVGSRVDMEKEGLKRSLDLLESNSVEVDYIVTDRHPRVQRYLQERQMTHYYDVWRVVKGLSQKLEALANKKGCKVVQKWLPRIKSHLHWAASSSNTGPETVAKWKSLFNHIRDVPKCLHPASKHKRLKPGTAAMCKIEKLLLNKKILTDVLKLSSNHQTSSLECFHSLILHFVPQNVNFPFVGMLCRLYLAAMHYNENASSQRKLSLMFPKSQNGRATVRPLKTETTFGYRSDLMQLVLNDVLCDPDKYQKELQKVLVPPSPQFQR